MARLSRAARVPELNRPPVRLMDTPLADIRPLESCHIPVDLCI